MAGSPRIIARPTTRSPAACRRARVRQGQAFGGAEEAPSLTAAARDGDGSMRSGRKNARGAGRTKEWNAKDDQNGVTPPRQREADTSAELDRRCARRRWKYAVGTEECSRRGSNKRMECKGRPKWRDAPLTKKAPYKPDAGNLPVRFDERDVETEPWWNH